MLLKQLVMNAENEEFTSSRALVDPIDQQRSPRHETTRVSSVPGDPLKSAPKKVTQPWGNVKARKKSSKFTRVARKNKNKESSEPFRFQALPSEIRLMIYEIHLTHYRGLVRLFHRARPFAGKVKPSKIGINLLLTCREIYDEAIDTLYIRNTFCITPLIEFHKSELCSSRNGGCQFEEHDYEHDLCCDASPGFEEHSHIEPVPAIVPLGATNLLGQMGAKNRARIRKIEILMPTPEDICLLHILPMSCYFPNLKSQILFFDLKTKLSSPCVHPNINADYFKGLANILPKCASTEFDLRTVEWMEADERVIEEHAMYMKEAFNLNVSASLPISKSKFCQKLVDENKAYSTYMEDFYHLIHHCDVSESDVEDLDPTDHFYKNRLGSAEHTDDESETEITEADCDVEAAVCALLGRPLTTEELKYVSEDEP